jgi:hypothetical protein
MRLTVFNGSPRGRRGNTEILLSWFLEGFEAAPGNSHETAYLCETDEGERFASMFRDAEAVFLAFPLYTNSMPGIVKAFIDSLAPLVGRDGNPRMLFLVQSGFPEAERSRPVERYLKKLAARLGSPYEGTIVRGECEGIHVMPPVMTRKVRLAITAIGEHYGRTGELDAGAVRRFAGQERLSGLARCVLTLMDIVGVAQFYWDMNLRKHGAYARRFARPYEGKW